MRREREATAAAVKHALSQQLQHDPPHAYVAHVAHMTVSLDALLEAVQAAANQHAAAFSVALCSSSVARGRSSSSAGRNDVSWVPGAMLKLKELLLESNR